MNKLVDRAVLILIPCHLTLTIVLELHAVVHGVNAVAQGGRVVGIGVDLRTQQAVPGDVGVG